MRVGHKTGTLTTASARLARVEGVPGGGSAVADVLPLAAGLEADVPHPVARGLVAGARARGIEPAPAEAVCLLPGRGVAGRVEGRTVMVGSVRAGSARDW